MFRKIMLTTISLVVATLVYQSAEAQTLNGDWRVISGVVDGQRVPTASLAVMRLKIDSAHFSAVSGNLTSEGTVSANVLPNPAQLTFTIEKGADAGNQIFAIYKLDANSLTITYSRDKSFPISFESTPQNRYIQLVYSTGAATGATAGTTPPTQPNSTGPVTFGTSGQSGGGASQFK